MPSPDINANVAGGAGVTSASSSTPAPPPLGTLIDDGTNAGALQLAAVLGYGGYGVVYRAAAPSGGLYAVKCLLRTSNPNNPKQAQRQRRLHMREIALHRLAGAGAHPGIVRLHRIIEPALPAEDGTLSLPSPYTFLVMDYAPCGDLFTLILHKQVFLGRTSLVGSVFAQLAAAVSHCHSLGIFHRDLKPENVLCWDGGATVRLADFGLATTERRSREWRTGSVYHMSPECQNGNASSPPYSPLANDIWSLAILLLNLLTARNPWARASPSDPTFSAYLASPRNFLPQVLPISSGLNDILVRALDVRWERRETFGVDGLAEGVARLVADFEESESRSRRSFSGFGRQRSGMYAPDVVFEGGMARCPWEVGMHIPSGSTDSEVSNQIPIPQELVEVATPEPPAVKKCSRSSSASYTHSAAQSPSPSFMVEESDIPPSTPAKEETSVEVQSVAYSKQSPSAGSTHLTSRWSTNSSASPQDSTVSEIRFANPSDAEVISSSSSASTSSSSATSSSSTGSEYSATRTPGMPHITPEPHVSDADLTLAEEEGYAYAYAASPDTPIKAEPEPQPKSPYPSVYEQPSYAPSRRSRCRGRSRGRQPYPQLASRGQRDGAARRAKFQPRRRKPELRVNVDLPAFLPMHVNSSGANGSATARTHTRSRSSVRSVVDVREGIQEHSVESCPFAYSVSQSASFVPGPDMEVDNEHQRVAEGEYALRHDNDIHMISPSCARDEEEYAMLGAEDSRRYSTVDHSDSFHTSFDGFSLSPSPVSRTSPAAATEDARENTFRVSSSGRTLISPSSVNMEGLIAIDRSTYATTSPTDVASPQSANFDNRKTRTSQRQSGHVHGFFRSASPSASSSLYRAGLSNRMNDAFKNMLGEFMDTDELGTDFAGGFDKLSVESSGGSWVDDLRRVVDEENQHAVMEMDEADDLPGLPGSFPASPVTSVKKTARQSIDAEQEDAVPVARSDSGVEGLGLDLFSSPPVSPRNATRGVPRSSSVRYSVPPPSIRSRTNSADEALRALHAIAIESPGPWKSTASSQSSSSVSTHGAQTFMAITTDVNGNAPVTNVHVAASATTEDFREYMPYLQYIDSSVTGSRKVSPVASIHSFRAEQESDFVTVANPTPARTPTLQRRQTPNHTAQCQQDSISTRRRSRPGSLLKFVSRRPFSSSGSGFIPLSSSGALAAPTPNTETGLSYASGAAARFSAAYASKDGRRISATVSDYPCEKAVSSDTSLQASMRPRSASYPHPKEQSKGQRIESPDASNPVTKILSRRPSANASKSRTWSFTRSRSQSRRRSRSVSPPPTKGNPRDVLFRLRSARNWFWYALSSMTSRAPSDATGRVKKGVSSKWASTPYVPVAA